MKPKNKKIISFTDLIVWQKAHQLVLDIYKITEKFPKKETYSLTDQMRRAAVSVSSNIAEGFGRYTYKDKIHFYY
jgi:four helix bundle protein